jgi:hypothetical protein
MSFAQYSTDDLINNVNNAVKTSTDAQGAPQQGSETRTSILPSMLPSGLGFFGSPYQAADAMMTPPQIGVKVGNSMGDVVQAVRGVGFYADQIGFGQPSTRLTRGMPLKPLGVNYFIKTGMTCSNGATMWHYMEGIPKGDALGPKVQKAMKEMGLPELRGLAPGMIEDVKNGLDPAPLINAMFGSGYPKCKQVTKQVGDSYGRTSDPDTGQSWIGDRTGLKGTMQTRWVQDTDFNGNPINVSRDQWVAEPKTFNPDGTPVKAKKKEGFQQFMNHPSTVIVVGVLCLLAFGMLKH